MAVSTSVFAPSVKAVQPAFIYNTQNQTGEVKVYFSLSSYNKITEITKVKYTAIDPNVKSGESSSIFKPNGVTLVTSKELDLSLIKTKKNNVEVNASSLTSSDNIKDFYFVVNCSTDLQLLKLNQYYQIQIYLKDSSGNYSAPSQATLIRPISQPQLNNDILNSSAGAVKANQLKTFSGSITYSDNSIKEYLAKYKVVISKGSNQVYSTNWVYNVDGCSFSTPINYSFAEEESYNIAFTGETVNGYVLSQSKNITIQAESGLVWEDFSLKEINNDLDSGAIKMITQFNLFNGKMLVQRAHSDDMFRTWTDVITIDITKGSFSILKEGMTIYDHLVKGNSTLYKYRFIKRATGATSQYISSLYQVESFYEDIFLSNKDKQLAIKYNPNVSGFKWVVQESITNTLGGRYPLIRQNGDTKYRQFNLSGTLYFDPCALDSAGVDSSNQDMKQWIPDTDSSLFVSNEEALGGDWNVDNWSTRSIESRTTIYESRYKDVVMQFLTDGKPKLFRSSTEGYMLVLLTNVSFTPNKQLGRRLVDFSATVTEFAEPIPENFAKYSINYSTEDSYYVLLANSIGENGGGIVTPYVSLNKAISLDNNNYRLKLLERKVTM